MWASRSKWSKPPTPSTPTPTRSLLERGSPSSRGRRGQGETNPLPLPLPRPLPYPLPTATRTPATQCPPGQKEWRGRGRNWVGGKGQTKEGNRIGQTALAENGAERRRRRRKGKTFIVVVRSPCQENYPADAHPSALKSVLESANPAWTWSVHLDAPGQRHGQQPVSRTADPGVVKQDKSSRGSVDTTKTRSGPQRVRMSSGERPIGAAKGKQSDTEAVCQPPPSSYGIRPF